MSVEDHHKYKKKRVGKACDSCRIKKTKCDGKKPCNKCSQDNKICVFTEKKVKEKAYPNGYVELLETRLDLLTKSFEKMIRLSRPHLSFIDKLVSDADGGDSVADNDDDEIIPINKVINYLIENEGLLKNLPIEWENGAMIAANFNANEVESSSLKFAAHKLKILGESPEHDIEVADHKFKREVDEFDDYDDLNLQTLQQMPLDGFSSGGFVIANSAALNDGLHSNDLSDFDSDSNSVYSSNAPPNLSMVNSNELLSNNLGSPTYENFRAGSLFNETSAGLFNQRNLSVSSLTNKLETHKLSSTTISPASTFESNHHHSHGSHSSLNSKRIQRPRSPSVQKLKNNGHIHKIPHIHSRSESFNNELINSNGILDNDMLPSETIGLNLEESLLKDL